MTYETNSTADGDTTDGRTAGDEMDTLTRPLVWRFSEQVKNPVIRPGQLHGALDSHRAGGAQVMDMGDHYRMYYWGTGERGNVILMAQSPKDRPNDWEAVGGVLLGRQPEVALNANGPSFAHVFQVEGDRWHMIFCAWGQKLANGRLANTTGLAISDDAGLTWRYHDEHPVLPCDRSYDHSATGSVWVTRVDGEYRMYYTAIGDWFDRPMDVTAGHGDLLPLIGIGYATSRDGVSWQKPMDELMIAPRLYDASPYEYIVSKPCVVKEADGWRMFVSTFGPAYRVHSLVSRDGLVWSHVGRPAADVAAGDVDADGDIGIGESGAFDDHQRSYASVVRHENEYRMWYTGNRFGATGMGYCTAQIPTN